MSKWLSIPLFIFSFFVAADIALAEEANPTDEDVVKAYLAELIKQSIEKDLSGKRYWRLLLHYKKDILGGHTSEADGPGFFLSPNGRKDPQAELEAALTRFFSDEPVGTSQQQAQCAFPARYQWLKKKLDFDKSLLQERNCERFKNWIEGLDPASVTLIFPSAYMNNPASMFGHTLLRIDQKGQTEQTRILAYVINYAADVDTESGIAYMFLGLSGGFKGYFSIMPYYLKVQEYSEMKNRDIWEYRLTFNEAQIERMLMHAWELQNTYFDYYYLKENCSYHLLSLLEVADPDLQLTDRFRGWTIPTDTVRLLTEQPGLVTETVYRPSRSTQIQRKMELLSEQEERLLHALIRDPVAVQTDRFAALPINRQAFVLDTAYDYVRYRSVSDDNNQGGYKKMQEELLSARSALRVRTEEAKIKPNTAAPEKGHRTLRVGVGAGLRGDDESFEELAVRAAYHDLLDDETGYIPDSQIEIMSIRVRYDNKADKVSLNRLTLASIISLFPLDPLFRKPSWKLNVGWERIHSKVCRSCPIFDLNVGIGGAIQTRFLHREVLYAMAEVDINYGSAFEEDHRVGGGGTVGLLFDLTKRWKGHIFTTYLSFPLGDRSNDFRVSFQQRFTLTEETAVRLELNRRHSQNEALLRLDLYF